MTSAGQRICQETPARVQSGAAGNQAAGEGQAKVNMPFCTARRVPVLALIRSRKTLSAACGSSPIQAAAACRVMPGGRLGAMKSQLPPVCIFAASFMLRTISKGAER